MSNTSAVNEVSPLSKRTVSNIICLETARSERANGNNVLVEYLNYIAEFYTALNRSNKEVMREIAIWHKKRELLEKKLIRAADFIKINSSSSIDKIIMSFKQDVMHPNIKDDRRLVEFIKWLTNARPIVNQLSA